MSTFRNSIDTYVDSMVAEGRLNSSRSVVSYRSCLERFAGHVENRDPRTIGRSDVASFLALFPHPNTRSRQRAMLSSFFKWCMWEDVRKDNPAEQTRPPKPRKPNVYRLTLDEVRAFLLAARTERERRVAFLGVCAGLRRDELRLLQGRHLARPGWVWVSSDIAKGGRERWVPVLADLRPLITELAHSVEPEHYVLPAQQFADPPRNQIPRDYPERAGDGKTVWRITRRIGKRAGISAPVNPHMLRHAFADFIARGTGVRNAQMLLGHASISTTEGYLSVPSLDELADSIAHLRLGLEGYPLESGPQSGLWRRWESNPRTPPAGAQSPTAVLADVLADLHRRFEPLVRGVPT